MQTSRSRIFVRISGTALLEYENLHRTNRAWSIAASPGSIAGLKVGPEWLRAVRHSPTPTRNQPSACQDDRDKKIVVLACQDL